MFVHKNHAAGGGNGSIIVGMFVFLCLASQKRSERDFFVPARTDLGVKLLNIYQIGYWKTIKCNDLRVLAHRGLHHTKPYKAWVQKNTYCCHYRARQLLSFAKFLSFSKPFFSYFTDRSSIVHFLPKLVCLLVALPYCHIHVEQDHSNCYWQNFPHRACWAGWTESQSPSDAKLTQSPHILTHLRSAKNEAHI